MVYTVIGQMCSKQFWSVLALKKREDILWKFLLRDHPAATIFFFASNTWKCPQKSANANLSTGWFIFELWYEIPCTQRSVSLQWLEST